MPELQGLYSKDKDFILLDTEESRGTWRLGAAVTDLKRTGFRFPAWDLPTSLTFLTEKCGFDSGWQAWGRVHQRDQLPREGRLCPALTGPESLQSQESLGTVTYSRVSLKRKQM